MSYEQEFLKEFEEWVTQQIAINQMAMEQSQLIFDENQDEAAREAVIRYESRLDAYQFLKGKFHNFHEKKGFHELPEDLFGKRHY